MIMSFKMALRSIGSNKLRAVLTMLGIIIGVMALVMLVSLVNGATRSVTDQMASLGSNYVQAYCWAYGDKAVTMEELEEWVEEEPLIEALSPEKNASATAKYGSKSQQMQIVGTSPAYYEIKGLQLAAGRFIKSSDLRNNSRVCILGPSAVDVLVGYSDCIGDELSINGLRYTIVGVLGKSQSLMYSGYGENLIYIPFTTMDRQFDTGYGIDSFYATAPEGTAMADAESAVRSYLSERVGTDDWGNENFYVYSMDVMETSTEGVTNILSILLGGIASISLIVGGIGIMNIMLVTVTERTREIGIRKAIGASRGNILRQFLMEAVVLCMMGCAIGIFLSWCILRLANVVVAGTNMITFDLDGGVVLVSVGFCFLIGIIFGLYPANKAAKMKPIDALRYGG